MLIDEQIIKDLTKISDEFKRKLLAIIKQGNKLDRIELAKLVAEIDFWKDLDLETQTRLKLTELFDKYDDQINNLMKLADVQKVRDAVSVNKDILETLKYFRGEELLGRAKVFSDQLKNTLLSSIITGKTFNQVKEDLANIPLTSPQLNTVISTGYNDYGRNLLALTYEKYPEQRFLYYGTIIPTSSKQCTWLLMNQIMTGYTRQEIEIGIDTPYGVINWNGRIPNFNCDDMWLPVTETLIKSIKAFQERNKLLAEKVLGGK